MADPKGYYALLGVEPGSSPESIKRAYRELANPLYSAPDLILRGEADVRLSRSDFGCGEARTFVPGRGAGWISRCLRLTGRVAAWGLTPRRSCDEARDAPVGEADDVLRGG
jgi:hypothetical protein